MLNKNFISKNSYLSKYDLINKYTLKNINNLVKIRKLKINLPVSSFLNTTDTPKLTVDLETQVKAYTFFYLLTSTKPLLNAKLKVLKSAEKNKELNYFLSFAFSKDSDIQLFLFNIFIENWNKLQIDGIKTFSSNKVKLLKSTKNIFTISIPLHLLHFTESILETISPNIDTKEVLLDITFVIETPSEFALYNKALLLKKLPILWIND